MSVIKTHLYKLFKISQKREGPHKLYRKLNNFIYSQQNFESGNSEKGKVKIFILY